MTIDHIKPHPDLEITNVLDINLRQKPGFELSWVTIINDAAVAKVRFDLNSPLGNHNLVLESIDLNSALAPNYSVLKTDEITLIVQDTMRFEKEPEIITVIAGEPYSWSLPKVIHANKDEYEILVKPDVKVNPVLSFDK